MGLQISTNAGAVAANYHLGKNSKSLEKSMARLASGLRIARPSDDAGGLAVSMKLKAAINRLKGAELNIQNGISFLEVQDGILESIGNIVDRMSELKGLSRDVMKNANDQETYNREFKDLQLQLKDMIAGTFNGVSLFAGMHQTMAMDQPQPQLLSLILMDRSRIRIIRSMCIPVPMVVLVPR